MILFFLIKLILFINKEYITLKKKISSEPETVMQAEVQAKGSKKRVKESEKVRRGSKRLKNQT
jgi:hypothetical protein